MEKSRYIKEYLRFNQNKQIDDLFEMANYRPKTTGLPMIIWISSKGNTKHGPRIKVQSNYSQKVMPNDLFVVTASSNPKLIDGEQGDITNDDLNKIFQWIDLNLNILIKLWNYELTFDDFTEQIKKI